MRHHHPETLRRCGIALLLVLLGAAAHGFGQQATEPPAIASGDSVEEIIVRAKSLMLLQQEALRAEQAFYDAFNAANSNDDFDIYCEFRATTGTHIKQRVCRAKFVDKLEADEAEALLRGDAPPPTHALMMQKGQLLTAEMRTLAQQRPDVLQALMRVATTRQSFDAEHARRCEGRILFCRRR